MAEFQMKCSTSSSYHFHVWFQISHGESPQPWICLPRVTLFDACTWNMNKHAAEMGLKRFFMGVPYGSVRRSFQVPGFGTT